MNGGEIHTGEHKSFKSNSRMSQKKKHKVVIFSSEINGCGSLLSIGNQYLK
jgi:hypothetical protein